MSPVSFFTFRATPSSFTVSKRGDDRAPDKSTREKIHARVRRRRPLELRARFPADAAHPRELGQATGCARGWWLVQRIARISAVEARNSAAIDGRVVGDVPGECHIAGWATLCCVVRQGEEKAARDRLSPGVMMKDRGSGLVRDNFRVRGNGCVLFGGRRILSRRFHGHRGCDEKSVHGRV